MSEEEATVPEGIAALMTLPVAVRIAGKVIAESVAYGT